MQVCENDSLATVSRRGNFGLLAAGVKTSVEERESLEERARIRVLQQTRERWILLGMIRQEDAHLLETVEGPYHPRIERSRDEYFAKKKEEEHTYIHTYINFI